MSSLIRFLIDDIFSNNFPNDILVINIIPDEKAIFL